MASIRYKPKFNVFAQSHEVKKTPFTSYRPMRGLRLINFIYKPPAMKTLFDGGIPFSGGSAVKDGGIPSSSGAKIYYGGKP